VLLLDRSRQGHPETKDPNAAARIFLNRLVTGRRTHSAMCCATMIDTARLYGIFSHQGTSKSHAARALKVAL
jgi:hypothetical protein